MECFFAASTQSVGGMGVAVYNHGYACGVHFGNQACGREHAAGCFVCLGVHLCDKSGLGYGMDEVADQR